MSKKQQQPAADKLDKIKFETINRDFYCYEMSM
jgi:hypothetical protein